MVTLIARHHVQDWDKWFTVYQEQRGMLSQMGVTREAALRSIDDGNDVIVVHEFESEEAANEFLKATEVPEMQEMLQASGVDPETMTMELFENN